MAVRRGTRRWHAKTGMDGARRRSPGSAAGDSRATSLRVHRRRSTGSATGDSRRRRGLDSVLAVAVVVVALIVAPHHLRLLEDVVEMCLDQRGEICFEEW